MTSKFGVVVKADSRGDIPLFVQVDLILQIESGIVDVNTIGDLFCRSIIERIIVVFVISSLYQSTPPVIVCFSVVYVS